MTHIHQGVRLMGDSIVRYTYINSGPKNWSQVVHLKRELEPRMSVDLRLLWSGMTSYIIQADFGRQLQ